MKRRWFGFPDTEQEWDDFYDYFPIPVAIIFGIFMVVEYSIYAYLLVKLGIYMWKLSAVDGRICQIGATVGAYAAVPLIGWIVFFPVHGIMILIFQLIAAPIRVICAYIEQHKWWANRDINRWI